MSQENSYSSIENNFNSLYSLNSSTDKNIEAYFGRNQFIPLKSPIFSSDEKRSTANDDISQENSFSPILRNNSELFSSNKNAERNNIFKEEKIRTKKIQLIKIKFLMQMKNVQKEPKIKPKIIKSLYSKLLEEKHDDIKKNIIFWLK